MQVKIQDFLFKEEKHDVKDATIGSFSFSFLCSSGSCTPLLPAPHHGILNVLLNLELYIAQGLA